MKSALPETAVPLGHDVWYDKVVDAAGNWVAIAEYHRAVAPGYLTRPSNEGGYCGGFVAFDVQSPSLTPSSPKWTVQSYEPLTLAPSLLCRRCGHHGFIRDGRWEPC